MQVIYVWLIIGVLYCSWIALGSEQLLLSDRREGSSQQTRYFFNLFCSEFCFQFHLNTASNRTGTELAACQRYRQFIPSGEAV